MADQRERYNDREETLRVAIHGAIQSIMTALPVQITAFDGNTVSAQPLLPLNVQNPDGTWTVQPAPPIIHAPVVFPSGGGFVMTFPIKVGDEALCIFAQRSIDEWYLRGGLQQRTDLRSHHISDGFVMVGPRSQPNQIQNVNPNAVEIRSMDHQTVISLGPGVVSLTAAQITAAAGGPAQYLAGASFVTWFTTNVLPFLITKGYIGPPPPVTSITTILKAQ